MGKISGKAVERSWKCSGKRHWKGHGNAVARQWNVKWNGSGKSQETCTWRRHEIQQIFNVKQIKQVKVEGGTECVCSL